MGIRQQLQQTISTTQTMWDSRWRKHTKLGAAPTAFQTLPEGLDLEEQFAHECFSFIDPWIDRIEKVKRKTDQHKDEPCVLADIPCGCGTVSLQPQLLQKLAGHKWSLLAADISPKALALYKHQLMESGLSIPIEYEHSDIINLLESWVSKKWAPDIMVISRIIIHLSYQEINELFALLTQLSRIHPWMITFIFNPYADHQTDHNLKRVKYGLRKNPNTWYIYRKEIDILPPLERLGTKVFPYFNNTEQFSAEEIGVGFVHEAR